MRKETYVLKQQYTHINNVPVFCCCHMKVELKLVFTVCIEMGICNIKLRKSLNGGNLSLVLIGLGAVIAQSLSGLRAGQSGF